jgi:hypothetical protein
MPQGECNPALRGWLGGLPFACYPWIGYKVPPEGLLKDSTMPKNKRVAFYMDEEWLRAITGLAGTFGVSAQEVIRRSLPEVAVSELFFRCKIFAPELRWDEVSDVGRAAIREHLRSVYMAGLKEHLARLGVSLESSADEVEAAKQRALGEMQADAAQPLDPQIAKAQEDAIYLGILYDAWKRAQMSQPGYTIAQVDIETASYKPGAGKAWAVLKEGQIV